VLHVQAPGDPDAPPELASWFTERAFHYYAAGLRLAPAARLTKRRVRRRAVRDLRDACTDLDAACARVRGSDGMTSVIVTAYGRGAVAAALWADTQPAGADALILSAPAWPRGGRRLTIACPVLVITHDGSQAATGPWPRRGRAPGLPPQLGNHVTWLTLAEAGGDQRPLLEELGRWLGAYMYGTLRDQLL
jgi:alpha-beta hydrolase superfamily lysophospholipase